MSTNIQLSGLASGIDTGALVDALMVAERQPIDLLEEKRVDKRAAEALVKSINGYVTGLKDAASALFDLDAFGGRTASSGDTAIATASAGADAAKGTYNVTVTSLAQAHTLQSDPSPSLGTGDQLDLTVDGVLRSYTFEAGDDLQTFADRINADEAGSVSASVVSGRLVLISESSGSAGAVTVGGSAAAALNMTETQAAQDAAATVNGVAVTGSGNTISDAIGGLDLTLTGVGSTTITVGTDTADIEAKAKAFVDAYNLLHSTIVEATSYDPTSETAGRLQGDQAFTGFASSLRSLAGGTVGSLLGEEYDSLAQIGITASKDGTLTLDSAAFQEALAADPALVEDVFAADDGIARTVEQLADDFQESVVDVRLDGFTSEIKRMSDRILAMEDRLDTKEESLRRQFSAAEIAISRLQTQQTALLQGLTSLGIA